MASSDLKPSKALTQSKHTKEQENNLWILPTTSFTLMRILQSLNILSCRGSTMSTETNCRLQTELSSW